MVNTSVTCHGGIFVIFFDFDLYISISLLVGSFKVEFEEFIHADFANDKPRKRQ